MAQLFAFNMMSLDGFFEGTDHNLSWHNVDEEFNDFAVEQIDEVSTILFGRITYEGMASYWTTEDAIHDDPIVANLMNSTPKGVFSHTLSEVDWQNTTLYNGDLVDEVNRLKSESDKDLALFGSANLMTAMTAKGLIDEYRIMINPNVIGHISVPAD